MRKFIRNKEDFTCKHCNQIVQGNGYTNHCPNCLYSIHIDKNPGDRQESCLGLMIPIDIISKGREAKQVVHLCSICKVTKRNILNELDSSQAIIDVIEAKVKREMFR